mgnify:CR=1 FL=1
MTEYAKIHPLPLSGAGTATRRVFVRDLELTTKIGVHRHERRRAQLVRINIDLTVADPGTPSDDRLDSVVDYEAVVDGVKEIATAGHINLVETLAERIASLCLEDRRVLIARVRVEKPNVLADAASVGVEIERRRPGA